MKSKTNTGFISCLFLIPALLVAAAAQDRRKHGGQEGAFSRLANGVMVGFTTTVYVNDAPVESQKQLTDIVTTRSNSISRVLIDEENGAWLGYDLEAEPDADGKQIRYRIKTLNPDVERQLKQSQSTTLFWSRARDLSARLILPKTGALESGWSMEIIVASNRASRTEIGDRIKFQLAGDSSGEAAPRQPRDFSANEIRMFLDRFRLHINGENVTGDGFNGGVGGSLVWVYIPGRGRYIFSLIPREGYDFQKIGVVEGDGIAFEKNGDRFELTSAGPIVLSGVETWNLWVLHDVAYNPDQAEPADSSKKEQLQKCCIAGAASDVETLLTREPRPATLRRP